MCSKQMGLQANHVINKAKKRGCCEEEKIGIIILAGVGTCSNDELTASPLILSQCPICSSLSCMITGIFPSFVGPTLTKRLPPLEMVSTKVPRSSYEKKHVSPSSDQQNPKSNYKARRYNFFVTKKVHENIKKMSACSLL